MSRQTDRKTDGQLDRQADGQKGMISRHLSRPRTKDQRNRGTTDWALGRAGAEWESAGSGSGPGPGAKATSTAAAVKVEVAGLIVREKWAVRPSYPMFGRARVWQLQ